MGKKDWRHSKEWRLVRRKRLELDNYTCVVCGSKSRLAVHHINHASFFKEQRLDINNLVTLCTSCHSRFHNDFKYGYRKKCTRYDWNNFLELVKYFKFKFTNKDGR